MNISEFFADWDNAFPALSRVAIMTGHRLGTQREMLNAFGDLEITKVREELVGDSYTGRMKVYVLTIKGKEVRVF